LNTRAAGLDITDSAGVTAFFEQIASEHGRLDILVNNAGVGQTLAPIVELSDQEWSRVLAATLTGRFTAAGGPGSDGTPGIGCTSTLPRSARTGSTGRCIQRARPGHQPDPNAAWSWRLWRAGEPAVPVGLHDSIGDGPARPVLNSPSADDRTIRRNSVGPLGRTGRLPDGRPFCPAGRSLTTGEVFRVGGSLKVLQPLT
jgi:hypothetical protein